MKKEAFDKIRKELIYLLIAFISLLAIFKIAFYKESLLALIRSVLSIFWLFVLPGYSVMLYWRENLEFIERLAIGIFLSAGILGIVSYYLGLIGLNIKYHTVLLPIVLILVGMIIGLKKINSTIDAQ